MIKHILTAALFHDIDLKFDLQPLAGPMVNTQSFKVCRNWWISKIYIFKKLYLQVLLSYIFNCFNILVNHIKVIVLHMSLSKRSAWFGSHHGLILNFCKTLHKWANFCNSILARVHMTHKDLTFFRVFVAKKIVSLHH